MLNWQHISKLVRLEGFKDPWEFSVFNGRALRLEDSLRDNGITSDAIITLVRNILVPEAWKVCKVCTSHNALGAGVLPVCAAIKHGSLLSCRVSLMQRLMLHHHLKVRIGNSDFDSVAHVQGQTGRILCAHDCVHVTV